MSNEKFLTNVKKIIEERGTTNKHIAEKCGYSSSQMCDLLHGRKTIKPCDIAKLCEALSVTPNTLFGI